MALRYAELSLKSDSLLDELNTLLGQKSHRITGQHQWQKKKKKDKMELPGNFFCPAMVALLLFFLSLILSQ